MPFELPNLKQSDEFVPSGKLGDSYNKFKIDKMPQVERGNGLTSNTRVVFSDYVASGAERDSASINIGSCVARGEFNFDSYDIEIQDLPKVLEVIGVLLISAESLDLLIDDLNTSQEDKKIIAYNIRIHVRKLEHLSDDEKQKTLNYFKEKIHISKHITGNNIFLS